MCARVASRLAPSRKRRKAPRLRFARFPAETARARELDFVDAVYAHLDGPVSEALLATLSRLNYEALPRLCNVSVRKGLNREEIAALVERMQGLVAQVKTMRGAMTRARANHPVRARMAAFLNHAEVACKLSAFVLRSR